MHICVVSPSFPTSKTIDFIFVEQLCRAFADNGHKVSVIAPQSVTKCIVRHIPIVKRHSTIVTNKGNLIDLYRPYYLSIGNSSSKLFKNSFNRSVARAFNSINDKPDVCYGHFWKSIFSIYPIAKKYNIPLSGASGEEDVARYVHVTEEFKNELLNYMLGVVSVSSKNKLECLKLRLVTENKSIVIPNAININLFRNKNKQQIRKQLGISDNDFVVSFTGQFIPRKGTLRLDQALSQLGDSSIKAIFMGSGSEDPKYNGIIFKGRVDHDKLPDYLSASDVFVLPTENEGCSNAIIEAMACKLPIISTDADFNKDILNEENSILLDCHNIDEISSAIKKLKEEKMLRESMAIAAYETACGLSIDKRAEKIIDYIKERINRK
ncbi:MAG: glycosyltransferase family 4 protein [Clostridiales bacterium]|nr:glycosyltransferase family 4 protein [Clostridiales bacterium]